MNSITSLLVFFLGAFGFQANPHCLLTVPGTTLCAVATLQAPPPPQEESQSNEESEDEAGCDESTRNAATENPFRPIFISNGF
jgi:hypothetical protein